MTNPASRTRRRAPFTRVSRWSTALLAVVVALFAVSGVAHANAPAQESDPGPTVVNSWSLSPSGVDPGQPGARPALTYSLAPGSTVQDSVVLRNYSNVPLTFRVYATDAYNTETGDFALLDGNTEPEDVGSWVKVSAENITLQPETGVDIPIEITVPADAQPGDHSGAILASSRTSALDGDGRQALLDRRVGSRVYLRVTGKLNPALVVEDLSTEYRGGLNPVSGDVEVSYTVRNAGNIRLGARQLVEVSDLFGTVESRKGDVIPQLLPGGEVRVHEHFSGVAATLRVSADVTLTPVAVAGADVEPQPETVRTAHAWAVPWSLLVLLAVIAGVLWWRRRRSRQRDRGIEGTRRTGGGGGGGGGPSANGHGGGAVRQPAAVRGARVFGRRAAPP